MKSLWNNFKSALDLMLHTHNHPLNLGVPQSILYYYKVLPIPILALLLISCLDLA